MKLSNLVGQGGLWYGFGRMVMKLCVLDQVRSCIHSELHDRLDDVPANEISNILVKVLPLLTPCSCS